MKKLKSPPDKLSCLRMKYAAMIKEQEERLQSLKVKLRLVDELESDAKDLDISNTPTGKYANFKLTKAVLDALANVAGANGSTATEVRNYMLKNGFQPNGKNFSVSVDLTLRRLVKQEKITSTRKESRRLYSTKTSMQEEKTS